MKNSELDKIYENSFLLDNIEKTKAFLQFMKDAFENLDIEELKEFEWNLSEENNKN